MLTLYIQWIRCNIGLYNNDSVENSEHKSVTAPSGAVVTLGNNNDSDENSERKSGIAPTAL